MHLSMCAATLSQPAALLKPTVIERLTSPIIGIGGAPGKVVLPVVVETSAEPGGNVSPGTSSLLLPQLDNVSASRLAAARIMMFLYTPYLPRFSDTGHSFYLNQRR